MMLIDVNEAVGVRASPLGGHGLFALRSFEAGALIERAPVLVVPAAEVAHLDRTGLFDYYFAWGTDGEEAALALGFCSFCNHAFDPNAQYVRHLDRRCIEFVARRTITRTEEITVNYNGDPDDRAPLWFEVTKP